MGATQSKLSEEQIQQLEECSYFRRHEIIQLDAYFRSISKGRDTIAKEAFKEIPELRYNPFRERIACIFSSDDGQINFDDFVDFFSVFSTRATREIKSFYAFRIYGMFKFARAYTFVSIGTRSSNNLLTFSTQLTVKYRRK